MQPRDLVDARFRIEGAVGSGGMGTVYRAIDERGGGAVALKVLTGDAASDLERARREGEVLRGLAHPGIVGHVAHGVLADGRVFVAMEWIDGITVGERLLADGFTVAEAVTVARRVAVALAAAHGARVLHRDVKPSNVLLAGGELDQVKLIDFGIARVGTVRGLTRSGMAVGTPGYMAPEQARGARDLGPAADVFGLGCLLHECATGRPAFSGVHRAAVLTKVLFAEPIALAELCPEAPPELGRVLASMLAKDAAHRLADGGAVETALAALGPIAAGPRRHARDLVDAITVRPADAVGTPAGADAHCLVLAARGAPDDDLEPPPDAVRDRLGAAVAAAGATLEVLGNGAVAVHVRGAAPALAATAERCAAVLRSALAGWTVVVSPIAADPATAADAGTAELAVAALAAIFGR